jgi:hypothetical protein
MTRLVDGKRSSTYSIWASMKARCLNPNCPAYKDYGGRGITVCERWLDFNEFLKDMGVRPERMQLERRDNDQGYNPDNCYWATVQDQSRNKRTSRLVTLNGVTKPLLTWCEEFGVRDSYIKWRLRLGDTPEVAFERAKIPPSERPTRYAPKVPDEVVEQIRAATGSQAKIAAQFGLSQTYVGSIRRGKCRPAKAAA